MKRTLIFVLIISLLAACFCVFAACNGNDCKHTFSDEWSADEEFHWRAATCQHKDEVSDKARHSYSNGVCSVCKYVAKLRYELDGEGQGYKVVGVNSAEVGPIVAIPEAYNGKNVVAVGRDAFSGCDKLESVAIPSTVTLFGNNAFEKCGNLKSVYVKDIASWCQTKFESLYSNPLYFAGRLYLNGSLVTELTIPDGVTKIGDMAFIGCSSVTKLSLSDSVRSIGGSAFRNCTDLTDVSIPDGVTSVGDAAFFGCSKLQSAELGFVSDTLSNSLFAGCSNLTKVTIPDSVKYIGNSAFYGCAALAELVVPSSVEEIGGRAFDDCASLKELFYKGGAEDWQKVVIGDHDGNVLNKLTVYYYSSDRPTQKGNYWHYENGAPQIWQNDN